MEQMKYHPKDVYYKIKDGVASIVLNYGEHQTEHIIAAQQDVHLTALRRGLAVSILFNLVLLIVFAVIIGGR